MIPTLSRYCIFLSFSPLFNTYVQTNIKLLNSIVTNLPVFLLFNLEHFDIGFILLKIDTPCLPAVEQKSKHL